MIEYINCSEAEKDQVFQAFKEGFSDYIIKITPTKDFFFSHFFGAEGNNLKFSWLALDGDRAIGLVLGGIRTFDGLKTIRCGTMCVIPDYRGKGISAELLNLHKQTAINENCDHMFLECIVGNDRALKFYKNNNYKKVYDLTYFVCEELKWLNNISTGSVTKIDPVSLRKFRESIDTHTNWQNEIDYIEMSDSLTYCIKKGENPIAAIAMKDTKIQFLYVQKPFRNRGYARQLIKKAAAENIEKLTASFPNNASLEGYYRRLGFKKEKISQVEMYRQLT